MSITALGNVHAAKIQQQLRQEIGALKLDGNSAKAAVQIAQVTQAVVARTLDAGLQSPEKIREVRASALAMLGHELSSLAQQAGAANTAAAQKHLALLAAQVGAAATLVRDGNTEVQSMRTRLAAFSPTKLEFDGVQMPSLHNIADAVAALAVHASIHNRAHSDHFGLAATDTALGVQDASGAQSKADGGADVRTRTTHLPLHKLQELAATGDAGAVANLTKAIATTASGVFSALQMFVGVQAGGAQSEGKALSDIIGALSITGASAIENAKPMFGLKREMQLLIERSGAELNTAWTAYDRGDDVGAALKDLPFAQAWLRAAVFGFIKNSVDSGADVQQFKHPDALSAATLMRGLPIVLGALEGMRHVDAMLSKQFAGDLSTQGRVSESGLDHQLTLEVGAQVAGKFATADLRQGFFADVVASEASPTLAAALTKNAGQARRIAGEVKPVLQRIALQAAQHYTKDDGLKASGSTLVAVQNGGSLLAAVRKAQGIDVKGDAQREALKLGERISLEDVVDMAVKNFGREPPPAGVTSGEQLRAWLRDANLADDWFVGRVAGVEYEGGKPKLDADGKQVRCRMHPSRAELQAAGKNPLSASERDDAVVLMFAANTGWKQQTERNDLSRVDSQQRGMVFNQYGALGGAVGDNNAGVYNLLKDAWEVLTKCEKLLEA